jgi:hypothetical protein
LYFIENSLLLGEWRQRNRDGPQLILRDIHLAFGHAGFHSFDSAAGLPRRQTKRDEMRIYEIIDYVEADEFVRDHQPGRRMVNDAAYSDAILWSCPRDEDIALLYLILRPWLQ